jgi:hypothetical protein
MSNQNNNMTSNQKETIIYIYSDFSPCCKQVQERVVELSQRLQFFILNIDNKRIRRMVLKCKRIRITRVPCLLIINPDINKVELYEGDNFVQAFDTLYNTFVVQPKIQEQQMYVQQQMALQAQQQSQQQSPPQQFQQQTSNQQQSKPNKGTSPLNLVIDAADLVSNPSQNSSNNISNTSNGIIQKINQDMTDDEQPKAPSKRKLGRNTFINDASLMPFDDEGIVAGNKVERPLRGQGHQDMAQSSLPEIGMTQDYVVSKKDLVANREAISVDTKSAVEPDDEADEMMYDREIALPGNTVKTKMGDNGLDIAKKVPVKIGKKTEMILDLSEAMDETDTLFTSKEDINIDEMRGGPPKNDVKTQKMSAAKMAAEQMMKERSAMMEKGGR